jgi:aryl-alcohol dehydrogenase-like predicted oxidoreductase
MISYCQDAGTGLIPWSPLARGVLSRPRHGNVSSNVPDRSIRESTAQMINVLVHNRQTTTRSLIGWRRLRNAKGSIWRRPQPHGHGY